MLSVNPLQGRLLQGGGTLGRQIAADYSKVFIGFGTPVAGSNRRDKPPLIVAKKDEMRITFVHIDDMQLDDAIEPFLQQPNAQDARELRAGIFDGLLHAYLYAPLAFRQRLVQL